MPPKKRTIRFYTIEEKEWQTEDISPSLRMQDVIEYIKNLNKLERRCNLTKTKICFIDRVSQLTDDCHSIMIKSAKTEYRPRLLDRETVEERDNPKRKTEGDAEKTHFVIKYTDDDVYLILEKNGRGVNVNAIIKYLKKFTQRYLKERDEKMNFTLMPTIIGKENFLQEIKRMERISLGEVYVDKGVLGGHALNFSQRTQQVRHDVVLTLKAYKQESIRNTIEDIYNRIGSDGVVINKIRVRGKDRQTGGELMIDTSLLEKIESIEADVNELTGEVNSNNILSQLKEIADAL